FLNPDGPQNFKYASGFVDFCENIRKEENVVKQCFFPRIINFKRNIEKWQKHVVKKQSKSQNEIIQRDNPQYPSNVEILYGKGIPNFCTIDKPNNQKPAQHKEHIRRFQSAMEYGKSIKIWKTLIGGKLGQVEEQHKGSKKKPQWVQIG